MIEGKKKGETQFCSFCSDHLLSFNSVKVLFFFFERQTWDVVRVSAPKKKRCVSKTSFNTRASWALFPFSILFFFFWQVNGLVLK